MRLARIIPLAALLLCVACSGRQPAPQPVVILTDADSTKLVTLALNQDVVFRLSSNQSTGYTWFPTKVPAMLEQVGNAAYVEDAATSGMVGAGGTEEWGFKVVARGTGILEFSHQRAWEKAPAKKRHYNISVW